MQKRLFGAQDLQRIWVDRSKLIFTTGDSDVIIVSNTVDLVTNPKEKIPILFVHRETRLAKIAISEL